MFFEQVQINVIGQYLSVFFPESRIFYLYLVTAILLAFFVYQTSHHEHSSDDAAEKKSFLAFLFDRDVFTHASTRQDLKFFLINAIVYYGIASQFLIGTHGFAALFNGFLVNTVGPLETAVITTPVGVLLYTVLSVIAIDLGVYISHRAQHEIPFLWEFHKVHHSAEKLNPLTLYRMHPVDLFFSAIIISLLSGIAYAGLFFLTAETPQAMTLLGLNIITAVFYILGYNLRHSHIWLSYPGWLSRILISPAQHQIHHSSDPKHFDMNFGLIFAIWDGWGKSLYVPKEKEDLTYGLSRAEPNPFKTVGDIYIKPFVWAGDLMKDKIRMPRRRVLAGLVATVLVIGYAQTGVQAHRQMVLASLPSVHLEKLTWTEVAEALGDGYDTVLIPTAGVEQNGPYVVLGKHKLVIERASHDIARTLGNTLVAPVVNFVPEGQIEPVTEGHMQFAGTISVSDDVFEGILRDTARSLKAHGFKKIFFLGDSGGNQDGQARIARELAEAWKEEGVTVAHLDQYYSGNKQFSYLQAEGYGDDEIGYHAGIRDTSEVLFVAPGQVRPIGQHRAASGPSGMSGNRSKANAGIGRQMVQLKVAAALAQIEDVLAADELPDAPETIAAISPEKGA